MRQVEAHTLRLIQKSSVVLVTVAAVAMLSALTGGQKGLYLGLVCLAVIPLAVLAAQPQIGLLALIFIAIWGPIKINTGTDVQLNLTTLLLPVLLGLWVIRMAIRREWRFAPSRIHLPLLLFLISAFLSLLSGNATWDPAVPKPANLLVVQLAQWGLWALSAGALVLMTNTVQGVTWLRRLTFAFLLLIIPVTAMRATLGNMWWSTGFLLATAAVEMAPFWICISALAGGQLLFNSRLSWTWRIVLLTIMAIILAYCSLVHTEKVSIWVGIATTTFTLLFLRLRRWRWLFVAGCLVGGILAFPFIYNFAGGAKKWDESGGSRLVLSMRVIDMTARSPILGLGPAAYRHYGFMRPLAYGNAYWIRPVVNSHDNYVDIYSQTGLVGLGLFIWFMGELVWLGYRLQRIYRTGFSGGYVNAMLAGIVAILVTMFFLDWLLPFVYNVGFRGFQGSVLLWLFLGGLVYFENLAKSPNFNRLIE